MRSIVAVAFASLVACNPTGTFEGRLLDPLSNAPRAGVKVLARAAQGADLTCQVREAKSDENGVFRILETCPNTEYAIDLGDDTLVIADSPKIAGGVVATGAVDLVAWRAPAGAGVYKLSGDTLNGVRSFSDVGTETILGTTEKVRYPTKKPISGLPQVGSGSWLVLAGQETIDRLAFVPLEEDTGVRAFENGVTIESHVYFGTKFTSDTEFARTEAKVDTSKVANVSTAGRAVRYIPSDALPEGRYGLLAADDTRAYVIDFGTNANRAADAR